MIEKSLILITLLSVLSGCAISRTDFGFSANDRDYDREVLYSIYDKNNNSHLLPISCSYTATTHFGPFFVFPLPFIPIFNGLKIESEAKSMNIKIFTLTNSNAEANDLVIKLENPDVIFTEVSRDVREINSCNSIRNVISKQGLSSLWTQTSELMDLCTKFESDKTTIKFLTTVTYLESCEKLDSSRLLIKNRDLKILFDEVFNRKIFWGSG